MAASSIKQKIGKCLDCPAGSPDKPLIAGRCRTHYWPYRAKQKEGEASNIARQANLKDMGVFMASQLPQIPAWCENNCMTMLTKNGPGGYKTHIAHILGKADYKSVKTHPQNRWFACGDCHTDYDKKGAAFREDMPVWPLVKERFLLFMDLLTSKEVGRLAKEFPALYTLYQETHP